LAGLDPGIPFAGDLLSDERDRRVYDFLTAPVRLGRPFMVSSKVPVERVTALRTAFDTMVSDPAFLAEAQKLRLIVTPMSGAEVDRRIADLYAVPPELVRRARAVTGE
jgi:tripartite-type tricarboxylate transporter receptor subunit TctC